MEYIYFKAYFYVLIETYQLNYDISLVESDFSILILCILESMKYIHVPHNDNRPEYTTVLP